MKSTIVLAATFWSAVAAPETRAQFQRGDLYVSSFDHNKIYRVDPATWTVIDFADAGDGLDGTSAVAFSPAGTLLCSNYGPSTILEFDSSGNGSLLHDSTQGLKGPFGENGLAWDANGDLYVSNFDGQEILRFPAGGGAPTVFADASDGIISPDGLGFLSNGDLLVANRGSLTILRIDPSGTATVFDTLPDAPFSLVVRTNDDVYVVGLYGASSDTIYRYPGGESTKRTSLTTVPIAGNPALQLDPDETWLYYVSSGYGNLLQIDPDTGSWTEVVPVGSMPSAVSIAIVGDRTPNGTYTPYGVGKAGNGGYVPTLDGIGDPNIGTRSTLQIRDFVGGASGLIVVSGASENFPAFGGTIYVSFAAPHIALPIVLPGTPGVAGEGDLDLDADVPDDPVLVGIHVYLQVLSVDRAVSFKMTMSNGLDLFFGD